MRETKRRSSDGEPGMSAAPWGQGDAYDSPPRRRDETAVRRREYSARERSACASHSNEDVSSPRRSCWRPASVWPVRGSPPSRGQPPPATGRSSAVPTAMASRPTPNLLKQWDADGPALAWKVSGLGTGYSSLSIGGDRLFTMGDLEGSQYVIAAVRRRRQAALEGQGRADLAGHAIPGRARRRPSTARWSTAWAPRATWCASRRATGKERWRKNLPRDFGGQVMSDWKFAESPLIDGDRVVVTPARRTPRWWR